MTCEQCRQQMLPFLYDLLEPLERETLAAHLESCAECQAALTAAREQQGMLAEAVKQEHADIVFKAPTLATPASSAPTVAMRRPSRGIFLVNRWAVAAAIFLLLFSVGGVIGWSIWRDHAAALTGGHERLAKAKDDLDKSRRVLDDRKGQNQKEILAIQEQIDTLFGNWKQDEAKTQKVLEKQGAQLILKGPPSPQAGANNSYEIEWRQNLDQFKDKAADQRNLAGQAMPQVNVRVFNQKQPDKALFQQQLQFQGNNINHQANFVLPSNLPIKPNEDIALELQLVDAAGKLITWTDNLKLVAPEYVTHLATDRPLYRPGDTVRFRSLTLERFSLKPAQEKFHLRYRIVGPDNQEIYNQEFASNVVAGKNNQPIKGPAGEDLHCLGTGECALPANLLGGAYTLSVSEVNEKFNEEKRTFQVHRPQPARFTKEIQFQRSSYAAGDQLRYKVRIEPVQANRRESLSLNVRVNIDNQKVDEQRRQIIPGSWEAFEATVPMTMTKGIGSIVVECGDGPQRETLVRDIPLIVRDLQVEFFPESGDLIAGVNNRVYVQARTPADKPTDMTGRIVDDKNNEVARIQTEADANEPGINQGLGILAFAPEPKRRYRLIVESPVGVERTFALPDAKEHGVIMSIPQGVFDHEIGVDLMSVDQRRVLLVGAYCRGRLLDHQFVRAGANQPVSATLRPNPAAAGVYRVTVFDVVKAAEEIEFRPLAERLVYRKSTEKVDVAITSDRAVYHPNETVRLTLNARNERRANVPALGTLAVIDNGIIKQADEKTARSMPTHFLLTTEVRNAEDLENADVLLSDHPKAAASLDLLLGCQGWRRFAEQAPQKFQERQQLTNRRQPANANFLSNTANVTQFFETDQERIAKLDQAYVAKAIDLEKKLAMTEATDADPADVHKDIAEKQAVLDRVNAEVALSDGHVREVRAFLIQFALGGALLALLFVGFFLVSVGLHRLSDGDGNARPWLFGGLGLFSLLFVASILGTFAFMGDRFIEDFRAKDAKMAVAFGGPPPLANPQFEPADPIEIVAEDERAVEEQPKGLIEPARKDVKLRHENPVQQVAVQNQLNQRGNFNNFANLAVLKHQLGQAQNDVPDDRQLREQGNYQAILLKRMGRRVPLPAADDPAIVREYAHRRQPAADGRPDRADTVCWYPVLVMPDGKAEVAFDLPDTVTSYQILVHSHTFDGRLGTSHAVIQSKLPFTIAAKVPAEVSNEDQIAIPVATYNDMPRPGQASLWARTKGLKITDESERKLNLAEKELNREWFHVQPSITEGKAAVRIVCKNGAAVSNFDRPVKVTQDGFSATGSFSGVIDNRPVEHEITLPADMIPGSLKVEAYIHPSLVAELQGALAELQRHPAIDLDDALAIQGPNVLMLDYMKKQPQQGNPILEKRARQALAKAWQKLTLPIGRLTAVGAEQLNEIAAVHPVDAAWLERGEESLRDKLPDPAADAFRLWAVTRNDSTEDIDKELAGVRAQAKTGKDPRLLALVALSELNRKQDQVGLALMRQASAFQQGSGAVTAGAGHDRDVATTSLAILAWLKTNRPAEFDANLQSAVKWLGQQRRGSGSYGSPQATVLALKAMIAYHLKNPREVQGGDVQFSARQPGADPGPGNAAGRFQPIAPFDLPAGSDRTTFSARSQDPLVVSLANVDMLRPGKNLVHLSVSGANTIPYTLTWVYRTTKPANDPKAPITLAAKFDREQADEGATVKLTAVIENVSGKSQANVVAILGLPAGLSAPDAQFKKLQTTGKVSSWEVRGREVVLSWRNLDAKAKIALELDLTCRNPGVYRGPPSRAYVNRESDRAFWIDPLHIRIAEAVLIRR